MNRSGTICCNSDSAVGRNHCNVIDTLKPMLGFAAYSGTGKTTLLKRLLPWLTGQGMRVGMIKHAHHSFEVDHPGKDSFELRKAGAEQVLVASPHRWALMVEKPRPGEPLLREMVGLLDQQALDLILVRLQARGVSQDRIVSAVAGA